MAPWARSSPLGWTVSVWAWTGFWNGGSLLSPAEESIHVWWKWKFNIGLCLYQFWKACSHAGSFLFLETGPWPTPNQSPFFFLCRQRRAVCVGQEYPRVPGNRPPGRPVFPVEGKAGLSGRAGCPQGSSCDVVAAPIVQRSQPFPGRPPSSCPIASGEAVPVRSRTDAQRPLLREAAACVGLPAHRAL